MTEEDVVMSGDEDSKKRSRSKFAAERMEEEGEEEVRTSTKKEVHEDKHTSKRLRVDRDSYNKHEDTEKGDDFAALLKSYEKQKRMINTKTKSNKINNENRHHNINKPLNSQKRNKYQHKRDKREPSPIKTRIAIKEFENQFGDTTILPTNEEELAEKIATFLDEKNVGLVIATLSHLGTTETLKFLRQTVEKEEEGGLMTVNNARQRSPGGSFFYIVKEGVDEEKRKAIFTDPRGKEFRKILRQNAQQQTKNKNTKRQQPEKKKGQGKGQGKENVNQDNGKDIEQEPTKQDGAGIENTKSEDKNETNHNNDNKETISITNNEQNEETTTDNEQNEESTTDDHIQRIIAESLQT